MIFRSILAFIILSLITTPAHAKDSDIHSMLVGKKVLELVENRQLTFGSDGEVVGAVISPDGKYVVYETAPTAYLIKTSGGRPVQLLNIDKESTGLSNDKKDNGNDVIWRLDPSIAWSPNSKWFAFAATKIIGEGEDAPEQSYLMVFSSNGAYYASIPLDLSILDTNSLIFSPDSSKLAIVIRTVTNEEKTSSNVIVFDLSKKAGSLIQKIDDSNISIFWNDKGQSLAAIMHNLESNQLTIVKLCLDGQIEKIPSEQTKELAEIIPTSSMTSPDRSLEVSSDSSIKVRNIETQETKQVVEGEEPIEFVSWLPDSKLLLYRQPLVLSDRAQIREHGLNTLWVANTASSKNNTMCVALDFNEGRKITASSNCLKIAYISNNRLYVAELTMREPTPIEKTNAGLPLAEEEMKEVMMICSQTLGRAIIMYSDDREDQYPKEASLLNDIKLYFDAVDQNNFSGFLNSGKMAIRYLISDGTNVEDIQNPATTPMAEFDAGYNWKIVLYADGHSEEVSK